MGRGPFGSRLPTKRMGGTMKRVTGVALIGALVAAVALLGILPAAAQSSNEKPKGTEVGVTASEIHIAVVADVDNALAPGLFKGAVDGTKAGAAYLNSKEGGGGLAGRKVVVDFYDSKLNPSETRNATITACANDVAMVGGIVLFLTNIEDVTGCKDQAGAATGLPDMAATTVGAAEACAATAFPTLGKSVDCTTTTQDPQTYFGVQGPSKWLIKKAGTALHGPFVIGTDTKDAVKGQTILALGAQHAGIKADQGTTVGRSGRDPQSAYTNIVQQMKTDGSNYAYDTSSTGSTMSLLQESQLQGMDMAKVTWTNTTGYGAKIVNDNASVWEGMYQSLSLLPFEEAKYNKTVKAFVKYTKQQGGTVDTFAAYAFESVIAFRDAVNATVKANGVNGLTRANLIAAIKTLTDFDADGMAGTHSYKDQQRISGCFVMVRFVSGKWVRQYPTKKGTFDCTKSNSIDIKANLNG